jgi:polyribonucleotide nucleotidyltransferase
MLGSAIATAISDIPFDGPTASTQVGMIDGEFIFNPTNEQKKVSDLALTVASTRDKVIMIEAGAFYFCFYFSILDILTRDILTQETLVRAVPVFQVIVFLTEFFQKPPFILLWPPPICPPISPPMPP